MRCSVVFGVTLWLLVISISSSSFAINTAAYYQRCVTGRWPSSTGDRVDNTWPVAALTAGIKARYTSESRFLPTPPAFDAPVMGVPVPSEYRLLRGKTRWWKKFDDVFIHFDRIHERDRHTDRQTDTAWRHRLRLHSIARQKRIVERSGELDIVLAVMNSHRCFCHHALTVLL